LPAGHFCGVRRPSSRRISSAGAGHHPANKVFATYSTRADAILGDLAIPLLDELYRRIGAVRPR
jgi:hypothetical protein